MHYNIIQSKLHVTFYSLSHTLFGVATRLTCCPVSCLVLSFFQFHLRLPHTVCNLSNHFTIIMYNDQNKTLPSASNWSWLTSKQFSDLQAVVHTKPPCICLEKHINISNIWIDHRSYWNKCEPGSVESGFSSLTIICVTRRQTPFSRLGYPWFGKETAGEFHRSPWGLAQVT